jgi:hypothetical protein
MNKKRPKFPTPTKPLSFKKIVKRILKDAAFAKFIHGEIIKARDGDSAAEALVSKHFRPLPKEMKDLKLPKRFLDMTNIDDRCTTHPTFMLIDFATPAKIWRK